MQVIRLGRLAPAVAVAAFLTACADTPTPLGPVGVQAPQASVSPGSIAQGEVWICKDGGGDAGTFEFAFSSVNDAGGAGPNGTVQVDAGQCVRAVALDQSAVGPSARYRFTITETAMPADWALTGISVAWTSANAPALQPVVDVPNATVSNVRAANDLGATVTFTNAYTPPPPPPVGCTYTQGYWKTHSEFGPAPYDATWAQLANGASTTFYLSGKSWYEVFWTAPGGNAYFNLAHQYMAAKLSIMNGADGSAVASEIAAAEALFAAYTPAQIGALRGNSALRAQFLALAGTLDNYNNGLIGPGHCD